jgi:hypothetical protein
LANPDFVLPPKLYPRAKGKPFIDLRHTSGALFLKWRCPWVAGHGDASGPRVRVSQIPGHGFR